VPKCRVMRVKTSSAVTFQTEWFAARLNELSSQVSRAHYLNAFGQYYKRRTQNDLIAINDVMLRINDVTLSV